MKIANIYNEKKPVISFEVFPPKKNHDIGTIYKTIEGLTELGPDFISVTYGAGGNGGNQTLEIASLIKNQYGIEALAHLTCVNSEKGTIKRKLDQLQEKGIENLLALRGDMPISGEGRPVKDYQYAIDLVKDVKAYGNFSIGGAAYPEGHIECDDINQDIDCLKDKVEAGVEFLISQLFFENQLFYRFLEQLRGQGIHCKISAGIMPILNKKQIEKMIFLCGASLPARVIKLLARYEHQPDTLRKKGIEYAAQQVSDLIKNGVDGIHLYTMNKPEIAREIMAQLNI
ncbi:methylenetetrahydrofolate reductase [NAD(P)H] [Alkaliphilus crotonatoxidans]